MAAFRMRLEIELADYLGGGEGGHGNPSIRLWQLLRIEEPHCPGFVTRLK
jgi:hypothetical protein